MIKYEDFKKEILKDPEAKTAYDELSCEYDIIQSMIDTRKSQHTIQKTGFWNGNELEGWICPSSKTIIKTNLKQVNIRLKRR